MAMPDRGAALLALLLATSALAAPAPFARGFNLTNWLQSSGARAVHFGKFGRRDLEHIQRLGADVIRLPIELHAMTSGPPDYRLDPLFLFFLDQIVDWTEELGLHLILDNHTFAVEGRTGPEIASALVPVWRQMAAHFERRSALVYYEILNEPHGMADSTWNAIQQEVIDAIRAVDARHHIVVGPANWNSFHNLAHMPRYADDRLIYTFHFYEPFLFTHQGATWVAPSMAPVRAVPFPYEAARMPRMPPSLAGSWIGRAFDSYPRQGTVEYVEEMLDIAARFARERGAPLFCGEFGAYMPNSPEPDRTFWYEVVRRGLEARGLSWTSWDYKGGFGLFERGSAELFDHDLNLPLLRALGLKAPPQTDFVPRPAERGLTLYDDFVGDAMNTANWTTSGTIDYYSGQAPARGRYCLRWSGAERYDYIGFDFVPDLDLSLLRRSGFAVELWVRGHAPGSSFDIRLVNPHRAADGQLPWRMRYTVGEKDAPWDGQWHFVRLPLSQFDEHGAWDGQWHEARGLFDWSQIDRLEIVAEHHDLRGRSFSFDEIRIAGTDVTAVAPARGARHFALGASYPNPFNSSAAIPYQVAAAGRVQIAIYNAAGQKVRTLVDAAHGAGAHAVHWDGRDDAGRAMASGTYFYRMEAAHFVGAGKMSLLR